MWEAPRKYPDFYEYEGKMKHHHLYCITIKISHFLVRGFENVKN